MLERKYYAYDKWTLAYLPQLPRLGAPVKLLVDEAVSLATPMDQKTGTA